MTNKIVDNKMNVNILKEALVKCSEKFAYYEKCHLVKDPLDVDQKALVNRRMQIMICDALEKYEESAIECDHEVKMTVSKDNETIIKCIDCNKEF